MSPENEQTVEPNESSDREGCQGWRGQPGVPGNCPTANTSVNATAGSAGAEREPRVARLKDESCQGVGKPATSDASPDNRARLSGAEAAVGAAHSSEEGGNDAGAKEPHLIDGDSVAWDEVMAPVLGLRTPPKVQKLQRTLYRKAKENKAWRAWSLYGDLARRDVLETALKAVVRNRGKPGVDGVTVERIKADQETFLSGLETELREQRYRPAPVLRVWIAKADGKQRPLGIPTVKDRVVQMGLLLLLQPIFEADFHEHSYGYRPGKNAAQAMEAIRTAIRQGYYEVIDADLSGYFDTIDHGKLLLLVARRVSDGSILRLVKQFLKAPIVERRGGKSRIQPNNRGTPQGGVISPLLANLYLNSLDHQVNRPETEAKLVRYADDFVLLCRPGRGNALQHRLQTYLTAKGLTLNRTKTRALDARQDSFQFVGFEFSWRQGQSGRYYVHVQPSEKSQGTLRAKVRQLLNHWTYHESAVARVRALNWVVRGWGAYFYHEHCTRVFRRAQHWVQERLRAWLWHKYGQRHSRYGFFTNARLVGQYGLYQLPPHAPWKPTASR